jgi:hypothetical protein
MIYDEAWFPRIKGNNANLSLRLRPTPSGALRRAFFSGEETIQYQYLKLEDSEYHERLRSLASLEQDLDLDQDTHPTVIALYKAKVAEKRLYHELVRAAYGAQEPTLAGQVAAQRFREYTETAFGVPDRDVFNYIIKKIQAELIHAAHLSGTPAYERLQERFGNPVFTTVPPFPASLVGQNPYGSTTTFLSAAEIQSRILQILQEYGMTNWRVLIASRGGRFSVQANQRVVAIPNDQALQARRPERRITERRLHGLIAHEVLTHARRAEAGAQSPLRLLSIGLPEYLSGEEGVAALREQVALGEIEYLNQDIYFAIGLAYGLDLMSEMTNGQLRTMRQVYTILHDYLTVRYGIGDRSAQQGAFNLCRQIYITNPHRDIPTVFTRPLIYLTGNIAVSSLVAKDTAVQSWFDIGKYDPTNQQHLDALAELKIRPMDG